MRYTGIDIIRGASVIGMVVFHAYYLLEAVFIQQSLTLFPDIFWTQLGKVVAITFIVVSGFSLFLSEQRGQGIVWKKALIRSSILAMIALSISVITIFFFPEQRIIWGIIHFFALVSLISPLVRSLRRFAGALGVMIIMLGYSLIGQTSENGLLIPLGWIPIGFYSADYYPLIPWFGYYLLGYSFAGFLSSLDKLTWLDWKENAFSRILVFFGKNTLLIYVLHVPILYALFSGIFLL